MVLGASHRFAEHSAQRARVERDAPPPSHSPLTPSQPALRPNKLFHRILDFSLLFFNKENCRSLSLYTCCTFTIRAVFVLFNCTLCN